MPNIPTARAEAERARELFTICVEADACDRQGCPQYKAGCKETLESLTRAMRDADLTLIDLLTAENEALRCCGSCRFVQHGWSAGIRCLESTPFAQATLHHSCRFVPSRWERRKYVNDERARTREAAKPWLLDAFPSYPVIKLRPYINALESENAALTARVAELERQVQTERNLTTSAHRAENAKQLALDAERARADAAEREVELLITAIYDQLDDEEANDVVLAAFPGGAKDMGGHLAGFLADLRRRTEEGEDDG